MKTALNLSYIAVDGPIGAGKTTLAKMLAEDMGAHLCLEPAEKNPFLAEFYKDRQKNAFKTQIFFLLNRYQQHLELRQQNLFEQTMISDYTFAKDLIFAQVNLSEDELALYNTIFNLLRERLPKPDLVIYMKADSKVLLGRIKKRGVDYERPITQEYLEELTESYNKHFLTYDETPLLVVDTSQQNYLKNPEDFQNIRRAIHAHRGGTVHLIARS